MTVTLVNVFNIEDADGNINNPFELDGASSLTIAAFGGKTFLCVGAANDNGLSTFEVASNGVLSRRDDVDDGDDADFNLTGTAALTTVGGGPFIYAAGQGESGVSGFANLFNGTLLNAVNIDDAGAFELAGANALASDLSPTFRTFLFVAGATDNGISSFEVASDGTLTNRDNVDDGDDPDFELLGASALATARIGFDTYVFAAGSTDDGISSFQLGNGGELLPVDNVTDGGQLELNGVAALATARVGAKSFLFAAGSIDDGVSVFDVSDVAFGDGGNFNTNVFNVTDDATLNLNGAQAVTAAKIAGTTYLFIAGGNDDGVSVFGVHADGTLEHMTSIDDSDDADFELDGASALAVATVGSLAFLFVAGSVDDGVSSFRIETTGLTIDGTTGDDVIDQSFAPTGEFLPSELGDQIFGLAGNDTIDGLGGADVLTGGLGEDTMTGGEDADIDDADIFDFNLRAESLKGANRDVIVDFSGVVGGELDRIDVSGIDAKSGVAGNQKFHFIGKQGFHDEKGELHFVKKAGFVIVEGDVNGDGRADFQIEVHNLTNDLVALAKGDFIL